MTLPGGKDVVIRLRSEGSDQVVAEIRKIRDEIKATAQATSSTTVAPDFQKSAASATALVTPLRQVAAAGRDTSKAVSDIATASTDAATALERLPKTSGLSKQRAQDLEAEAKATTDLTSATKQLADAKRQTVETPPPPAQVSPIPKTTRTTEDLDAVKRKLTETEAEAEKLTAVYADLQAAVDRGDQSLLDAATARLRELGETEAAIQARLRATQQGATPAGTAPTLGAPQGTLTAPVSPEQVDQATRSVEDLVAALTAAIEALRTGQITLAGFNAELGKIRGDALTALADGAGRSAEEIQGLNRVIEQTNTALTDAARAGSAVGGIADDAGRSQQRAKDLEAEATATESLTAATKQLADTKRQFPETPNPNAQFSGLPIPQTARTVEDLEAIRQKLSATETEAEKLTTAYAALQAAVERGDQATLAAVTARLRQLGETEAAIQERINAVGTTPGAQATTPVSPAQVAESTRSVEELNAALAATAESLRAGTTTVAGFNAELAKIRTDAITTLGDGAGRSAEEIQALNFVIQQTEQLGTVGFQAILNSIRQAEVAVKAGTITVERYDAALAAARIEAIALANATGQLSGKELASFNTILSQTAPKTEHVTQGLRQMRGGLAVLALQFLPVTNGLGQIVQGLSIFALGVRGALPLIATLGALAAAYDLLTKKARESKQAADDFIKGEGGRQVGEQSAATQLILQQREAVQLLAEAEARLAKARAAETFATQGPFLLVSSKSLKDEEERVASLRTLLARLTQDITSLRGSERAGGLQQVLEIGDRTPATIKAAADEIARIKQDLAEIAAQQARGGLAENVTDELRRRQADLTGQVSGLQAALRADPVGDARRAATQAKDDREVARAKALNQSLEQINQQSFDRATQDIKAFFATRRQTLLENARIDLEALDRQAQRAAARPLQGAGLDLEVDRIRREQEVAAIRAKADQRSIQSSQEVRALDAEHRQAIKGLSDERLQAEQRILELQGRNFEATERGIEAEVRKFQDLLNITSDVTPAQREVQANQLRSLLTLKAGAEEAERQVDQVFGELGRAEQGINDQVAQHLISEAAGTKQIGELRAAQLPILRAQAAQLGLLAAASGDPAAIARVEELNARLNELSVSAAQAADSSRQLREDLTAGLSGAVGGFLTDTIDQLGTVTETTKTVTDDMGRIVTDNLGHPIQEITRDVFDLGDAFVSLARNVVDTFRRITADALTKQLEEAVKQALAPKAIPLPPIEAPVGLDSVAGLLGDPRQAAATKAAATTVGAATTAAATTTTAAVVAGTTLTKAGVTLAAEMIAGATASAAILAGGGVVKDISTGIGKLFLKGGSFAGGGFTGPGSKWQPAGVVHAGEFVFSAEETRKYFSLFQAIHQGRFTMPGYASGGLVRAAPSSQALNVNAVAALAGQLDISFPEGAMVKVMRANFPTMLHEHRRTVRTVARP